jgi:hypothetical protein
MAPKTCQNKKQSLICDLFNQVLNCNFDFKNQFNCSPNKFNRRPWSFKLVIGLEYMQLDPQLINKLSISSIQSLIRLIPVLLFTRLFQFGPWFQISSIKSLIGHQTSIFMQLNPRFDQINSKNYNLTPEL